MTPEPKFNPDAAQLVWGPWPVEFIIKVYERAMAERRIVIERIRALTDASGQ